tara:strand:- start:1142 stop:1246 length:105 start_codon:yes stop_codon:yes gene_type:complete
LAVSLEVIIKKEKVIKPTNQPSKLIKESEDLGIK